ncbi:protein S100-B-like isoform X1 [Rana temporaria]|uniref:protein S100-B-like isoform X1 n=1 Tax=Rana temporaria TaxID=8407 RepID=UPI001AAD9A15|nr:protein S100-B-like isoform X1 [Rana temporaria]
MSAHHTNPRMPGNELERALLLIIDIFDNYAQKIGDSNTIRKSDLKDLMKNELGGFLETQKGLAAEKTIMKYVDDIKGDANIKHFGNVIVTVMEAMRERSC